MRLNKTESRLLEKAARSRDGLVGVDSWSGRGPTGAVRRPYNTRERNAACSLRDKGLFVFVRHDKSSETVNGWTTRWLTSWFMVTDEGRKALKGEE